MPTKSLLLKSFTSIAQKLTSGIIILGSFWTAPVWAQTINFEQIYVFGDSLSDTGNFYNRSGFSFPPSPFYSQGRFTNGFNWIDFLSAELDLSLELYTSLPPGSTDIPDAINFAFGGATTSDNLGGPFFPGLEGQIEAFTNLVGDRSANSQALYTVWAGSNDYIGFYNTPGRSQPNPTEVVNNLSSALTTLAEAGASNILVVNLPNLGKTPFGQNLSQDDATQLENLSKEHNNLLANSIDQLSNSYDTNFISFDVNALFNDILASVNDDDDDDDDDDNGFGFTNVTDNCSGVDFPNVPIPPSQEDLEKLNNCLDNNPDEFLFWDNQHPTTAGHKVIAESALEVLKSEFNGDDDDDDDDDDGSQDKEDNTLAKLSDSQLNNSTSVLEPTSSLGIDKNDDDGSEDKEDNTLAKLSDSQLSNSTSIFEHSSSLGILAIGLSSVGSWLLSKKHRKS